MCNLRILLPLAKALKATKALVLALAALFCLRLSKQNGKALDIGRIPPPGILPAKYLNFGLGLPPLPQSSQKLLAAWRAKSYFAKSYFFRFRTIKGKGRKLNFDRKQPRSPYSGQSRWLLERGNEAFCLVFQEFYAVNLQSTFYAVKRSTGDVSTTVTVRSVKIHISKRPAFPSHFGRVRGGLVKKWFKFCVPAAKQLLVWPAEEVSFNFSEFKFEAFRPSDAWFANYKQIKFLRQNFGWEI